jgi:mono/diheme cytochrome c family protein
MRIHSHPARLLCALLACCFVLGCRASAPGKKETATMDWIKRNVTVKGKHDRNPLQQSAAVIADGKSAFGDYCTVCHGLDGQNTGVPFADSMSPPVPSLASQNVQRYTDGQLKWIIENGIEPSGMPASRGILSDEEMWSIVEYLRHLPPAGSLGEPRVYSGDDADVSHP